MTHWVDAEHARSAMSNGYWEDYGRCRPARRGPEESHNRRGPTPRSVAGGTDHSGADAEWLPRMPPFGCHTARSVLGPRGHDQVRDDNKRPGAPSEIRGKSEVTGPRRIPLMVRGSHRLRVLPSRP